MSNIVRKYEVGDTVMFNYSFKNLYFNPAKNEEQFATITGYSKANSSVPTYYINGDITTAYPEYCFAGRYES